MLADSSDAAANGFLDLGPPRLELPPPPAEVEFGLALDVFLEEVDLESLDPVGEHRHAVLADVEEEEGQEIGGDEEGGEEDPLHRRRQGEVAGWDGVADPARSLDFLREEDEGLAAGLGDGQGLGRRVEPGFPELGGSGAEGGPQGGRGAEEDALGSGGHGDLAHRGEALLDEEGDEALGRDHEDRAAAIDAEAVDEGQGVKEAARGGIDADNALRALGRRDGLVGRIAGLAVVPVHGLELGLGPDVAGQAAVMQALAVRVDEADAREAGRLFLELAQGVGAVEGVLGAHVGQETLAHRLEGQDGAEAGEVGGMVAGFRLGRLGQGGIDASDDRRAAEARLDDVEESREGRHGEGREEENGCKEAYASFLAYGHRASIDLPSINIPAPRQKVRDGGLPSNIGSRKATLHRK